MRVIKLLLLGCSIIIHFVIAKDHVFKIFNQYTYYILFVFYILIALGFLLCFTKYFAVDMITCIITPYISSAISFFFLTMLISPHFMMNNLWSSIVVAMILPYFALYSWILSISLVIVRSGIYYLSKIIKVL